MSLLNSGGTSLDQKRLRRLLIRNFSFSLGAAVGKGLNAISYGATTPLRTTPSWR